VTFDWQRASRGIKVTFFAFSAERMGRAGDGGNEKRKTQPHNLGAGSAGCRAPRKVRRARKRLDRQVTAEAVGGKSGRRMGINIEHIFWFVKGKNGGKSVESR
jgi:hypothetical protein